MNEKEKFCNEFSKFDYKSFSNLLFSLNTYEYNLIAVIIGFAIAKPLTTLEQNSLGNFFELVGQLLLTIAAQAQVTQSSPQANVTPNEFQKFKDDIEKRLDYLAMQIQKLNR